MTVSMGNQIQIGLLGWTSVVALATSPDFAVAGEYEKVWLDELSVRPVNGRLLTWSPADLAISDGFTSDGVTGVSLLHRLFPRLRLLVLSGGVAHRMKMSFPTHALSVLPKPCSLRTLRQAVREALSMEVDACLREIFERGRLGFLMAALRSPPIGQTSII